MRKVLVYLNDDCFSQVDDTVLSYLAKEYEVNWFYLYKQNSKVRLGAEKASQYSDANGIVLHLHPCRYRGRDLRNIFYFSKIAKEIKKINPDLLYHCERNPFFAVATFLYLRGVNRVLGVHDAMPHTYGRDFGKWLAVKTVDIAFRLHTNFITFSKGQQDKLFRYRGLNSTCVGMSCKSFGATSKVPTPIEKGVKLLFFGSINKYKGLDLLIEALEESFAHGTNNITLTIAGNGSFWTDCAKLIHHNNNYSLLIRFIENDEIPDLMSTHHFLVLPYRDVTQSGPMYAAMAYCLPVIAPNIGCFKDICNEETSILYEQGHLSDVIERLSRFQEKEYAAIRSKCVELKESLSESKIAYNYIKCFNSLIEQNEEIS